MGGNGKHGRWKISFHSSSSSSSKKSNKNPDPPPKEFLCPISGLLMFDPVVVASGQTFERTSVDVCRNLGFNSALPDGSIPNFSTVIPNLALKTTIFKWCQQSRVESPSAPDYSSIESVVRNLMAKFPDRDSRIRVSEKELLKGVAETPQVLFSHAASELAPRNHHMYSSSSSEESVIANTSPSFLPFTTRPACYSSPSSGPSTSSEIYDETIAAAAAAVGSLSEDDALVNKMISLDAYEQEQAVVLLRKTTRTDEESRTSLCTPKLLQALKPLLMSRYAGTQTNAVASLVNLSLANANKIKIVRSGMVPILIDLLKNGFEESQEHAAGAIFSLSLEDENKMAIGVLGALQPLLHAIRSGTQRTRHDSALALYHLTLVSSNRIKMIRLGAIPVLLGLLRSGDLVGRVLLVVCNLAVSQEGRSALLDNNAVECLVGILRKDLGKSDSSSESTREYTVAALYSLSHGSMRFKALARQVRAGEMLKVVAEDGSQRAKEKAKRILEILREKDEEEEEAEEEVDWEGVLESGESLTRHRVGRNSKGPNSTEF